MKYSAIFFLLIIFYSCESKSQSFHLPDKIEITDLNKKMNIKGTRVLIDKPKNYTYVDKLKRFQKSSDNYFQVTEIPNQGFKQTFPKVKNKINKLASQGGEVRIKKEFKLGAYNAYFILAPQGEKSEQVGLVFGDSSFTVLAMGVFPNDKKDRKQITDLILSIYINKDLKPNLDDNLYYKTNLKGSDFKISTVNGTAGTYTLNGKKINNEDFLKNHFVIGTLPNSTNFNLKNFSDKLIDKLENNAFKEKRIEIEILSQKEFKVGEDKIIKVKMNGKIQGKNLKLFQYIRQTPEGIIQFIGFDFTKKSKYISEYDNIASKIKLK